jgi:hypothetical protein
VCLSETDNGGKGEADKEVEERDGCLVVADKQKVRV